MRAFGLAVIACSMLLSARAHALDTEITSATGAQGYTLRSPFGEAFGLVSPASAPRR